ncbi:aromatic ring-hydroxylating dioxygenase subunit alpha [Kitasatospora sp. NPDC101447]|uniref:aromatic ring-hydroxylating oxygenase subunit alpha n=1 Tax=Kitasatospora sp. NPDC101447 TaxID=3364102 RepID=UPI00380CD38D
MTSAVDGRPAPLPYPSGWFCVGRARDLPPGRVRTARLMGEDVVLYRTRRGAVRAVGPHCPHLGAHFGAGGTVRGEELVCPFHGFAFGPDGSCTGAPDGTRLRASLTTHHLRERDGALFVWRGPDGQPPGWELPPAVGVRPLAWWSGEVRSHPQEVMENSVDFRHVSVLHGLDTRETAPPEVDGPLFTVHQRTTTRFPGLGAVSLEQPVMLAGLGMMRLTAELPQLGSTLRVWVLATPVAPWRTRVWFAATVTVPVPVPAWLPVSALVPALVPGGGSAKALDRAASWLALQASVRIIKQDRPVLAHKRYLEQPRLVPGERSIGLFRRWARQFYPEANPAD